MIHVSQLTLCSTVLHIDGPSFDLQRWRITAELWRNLVPLLNLLFFFSLQSRFHCLLLLVSSFLMSFVGSSQCFSETLNEKKRKREMEKSKSQWKRFVESKNLVFSREETRTLTLSPDRKSLSHMGLSGTVLIDESVCFL